MLRLALIENLRRVAVQLNVVRKNRDAAENWASRILQVVEQKPSDLIIVVGEMAKSQPTLNRAFVTEFLRRIQEKSPSVRLAVSWMEERLAEDGLTVGQMVQGESQYQAAAQVSVGNSIGSLRFLDTMDWQDFVEAQSRVEQTLRTDPAKIYPAWISQHATFTGTPLNASRARVAKPNLKWRHWRSAWLKKMSITRTTGCGMSVSS